MKHNKGIINSQSNGICDWVYRVYHGGNMSPGFKTVLYGNPQTMMKGNEHSC